MTVFASGFPCDEQKCQIPAVFVWIAEFITVGGLSRGEPGTKRGTKVCRMGMAEKSNAAATEPDHNTKIW